MGLGAGQSSNMMDTGEKITLICDETRFLIDMGESDFVQAQVVINCVNKICLVKFAALLIQYPNTLLGRMFSSQVEWQTPNDRGEYNVADGIAANVFRAVLDYYKSGTIRCPSGVSVQELREACDCTKFERKVLFAFQPLTFLMCY